ncbi:hypothetical protein RF11_06844 [Thelohanellus kitauei]|uniref:Uncharacterized protein n=1 Tax=Thelohanellus kitauei TaxID=669202 RepID=A0A0C2MXA3_THEKT|nr:hypothetical protein RF11_06844 [Thelohanellus kitauei]
MENNESARRNRIMVPMNPCDEFLANLHEIKGFVPEYHSKIPAKTLIKCKRLAFTATVITRTGMVYNFEVFEIDGYLSLQIRYTYKGRRDYIYLNIGFLDLLVAITKKLHRKYSSLTGRDDIVLDNSCQINKRTDFYSM